MEITGGFHIEKPTYTKALIYCLIREPKDKDGQKFTAGMFYDAKITKLLLACGKTLDDVFGSDDKLETNKLFSILTGNIITMRIGLKDGWNVVADIIEEKKLDEKI